MKANCLSLGCLLLATTAASASTETIGENGINSIATGLDGSGIPIGQGETNRAGKPMYDTDPMFFASNTIPTGVYREGQSGMDLPDSDTFLRDHATEVAGVMIGKNAPCASCVGVAPNANLHSMAIVDVSDNSRVALALNRLATLEEDVKAINLSFAPQLQSPEIPDGNSHSTQFIDWSAGQHDVLYNVAWGNDTGFQFRRLTDDYNGITVAGSERVDGIYRRLWEGNATTGDATGDRTSVDLMAPGENVEVLTLNDQELFVEGTSFATAHVTGTVALLQQFGEERIMNVGAPRWKGSPGVG